MWRSCITWRLDGERSSSLFRVNLQNRYIQINAAEISYFENVDEGIAGQSVLFIHGAGCHARCWDATIRILGSSLRSIAIELRGHGRSQKVGPYSWKQFGQDVCAFIQSLNLSDLLVVGHSMGGHIALQVAAELQECVAGLVLVDPLVFDSRAYELSAKVQLFNSPEEHPVAKRRSKWNSPSEWFEVLREREPYKRWNLEILWDHCTHGLVLDGSGKYELCCPPLVEAETYLGNSSVNVHPLLSKIQTPVAVIRCQVARGMRHPMDAIHSLTWPKLAENLPNARDYYFPDVFHFVPMQRPDIIANAVREFAQP